MYPVFMSKDVYLPFPLSQAGISLSGKIRPVHRMSDRVNSVNLVGAVRDYRFPIQQLTDKIFSPLDLFWRIESHCYDTGKPRRSGRFWSISNLQLQLAALGIIAGLPFRNSPGNSQVQAIRLRFIDVCNRIKSPVKDRVNQPLCFGGKVWRYVPGKPHPGISGRLVCCAFWGW